MMLISSDNISLFHILEANKFMKTMYLNKVCILTLICV